MARTAPSADPRPETHPSEGGAIDRRTGDRGGRSGRSSDVRFVVHDASADTSYRVVVYRTLERLGRRAGMTETDLARFLGVSPKTLRRRAERGVLGEAESMKTEMLHATLGEAHRILGGEAEARRWLTGPVASLDGLRPLDHLDSIAGYERVRETLTKIEYGMY